MRALIPAAGRAAVAAATGLGFAAGLACLGAIPAHSAPAATARAGSGGCYPIDFTWICIYGSGGPGGPGSSGSTTVTCTYTKAPTRILQLSGVGPPNPGFRWDIMTCPGQSPGPLGGRLIQVNIRTGAPAISPFELLVIAIGELRVPTLAAATAPPRGTDGLVGLPEWFWVARGQWQPARVTVRAGPVWATATARPTRITYASGGGGSASCAGPGIPFDRRLPASRQHTSCSYTYGQPSTSLPGHAYLATLAVTWTISWTGAGGAGGAGGVITNGFTTATAFGVRVAQAEALVTTP